MRVNANLPRDYNFGDPLTVAPSDYDRGYSDGLKAGKPVCPVHHDTRCLLTICTPAVLGAPYKP